MKKIVKNIVIVVNLMMTELDAKMDVNNKMENVSNCTQTEDTPTTKTFV